MIFFTGFLVGVVSLIPGISGGTILVLMNKYNEITSSIANFRKKENRHTLFFLIIGIILGTISFARIIEFCFYYIPNITLTLFSGLVLFETPTILEKEKLKPNIFFLILGFLLIIYLNTFNIFSENIIINYPQITIIFLLEFCFFGMMDGFFTILPGISGSMVMMILGPYFLYKSYLANLNFHNIIFVIPLLFYFLGDLLGIYFGSKTSIYFIKKHHKIFMSFILGMVVASGIILIPLKTIDFKNIILIIITLLISYIITEIINLIK